MTEFDDWRRVDPRTMLLLAVPAVAATAFFVLLAMAGGASAAELGIEVMWPLIGGVVAVARFVSGRFRVGDGAVHWTSGVFVRESTQVAIDRIQDVEVTRPLVARILGCSAVRVSSAGGAGEIELSYLDHGVAERLGAELRRLIGGSRLEPSVDESRVELHRVTNAELWRWVLRRAWPMLPVLPIALLVLARSVLDRVGLTVTRDDRTLYTSTGLTTLRRTTTSLARVHLVSSHRLWSQVVGGTETVRYASADVSGGADEGSVREELAVDVPVGSWERFVASVVGIAVPPADSMRTKPASVVAASRRRGVTRGALGLALPAALVGVGFAVNDRPGSGALIAAVGLAVGVGLGAVVGHVVGRRRHRVERWTATDDAIVVVGGVVRRVSTLLRIEKLQAVSVSAGPLQRRLGLVTVAVDVAPPGSEGAVVVRDVTVDDGAELLAACVRAGAVPLADGV